MNGPARGVRGATNWFYVERAPADPAGRQALAGRVVEHLATHESENNLPLGIATSLADGTLRREDAEVLLATDAAGAPAAALLMTPPYRLVVPHGDDPAARLALLEDMRSRGVAPPGVVGPEPAAAEVASWWAASEGLRARRTMRQGIYMLRDVAPAPRTQGHVRVATASDAKVIVPWLRDFFVEARVDVSGPEATFRDFVAGSYRQLHVFEVGGEPVCIAGVGGRTPRGRRIGPVYTPPERRRRGYAEALVAAVCRSVLAAGNDFCFLFTDLDNATANEVYRRIGFTLVCESSEYDLDGINARLT